MYAAIFPSDMPQTLPPSLAGIRVTGGVDLHFRFQDGRTALSDMREWDGYKVRFPNAADKTEAVIINTGGGVAGGDTVRISVIADERAQVTLTTPSAERIYGALGLSQTEISVQLNVADTASIHWLPQETILFDRARLKRSMSVDMAASATALLSETIIFGRVAMGETITEAAFTDCWRIKRGGKLVFAENLKLDGDISDFFGKKAIADGARVISTTLLVAPDAEDRLEAVRQSLAAENVHAAASAWNGMLVVRALGETSGPVRRMLVNLLPILSGNSVPRVWSS